MARDGENDVAVPVETIGPGQAENLIRRLLIGILALAIPLTVVSAWAGFNQVGKPFEGFLMQRAGYLAPYQRGEWEGLRAGMRAEDVVVAVDGTKVPGARVVHDLAQRAGIGARLHYEVIRGGTESLSFDVPVTAYRFADLARDYLGLLFVGLCYLVVGFVAAWLRPGVPAARGVWFMGLAMGLFCITYFDANSTYHVAFFCVVSISAIGAAFMYLAMIFPQEIGIVKRFPRAVWIPFIAATGFAAANWYGYMSPGLAVIPKAQFESAYGLIRLATVWLFLGMLTYLVLLPVHFFRAKRGTIARQQAAICIVGAALAFSPVGLLFGVPFALNRPPLLTLDLVILGIIMFPLSVAYAIVRHRLFDIQFVIRRSVLYTALTAILATIYIGVVTAMQQGIVVGANIHDQEAGLVATAIVVALFVPLRDRLRNEIDRRFFRQAYDAQRIVEEVSTSLVRSLDLDLIARQILSAAQSALHATSGALFMWDGSAGEYRAVSWIKGDQPAALSGDHPVAGDLEKGELLTRLVLPIHKKHRVSDKLAALEAEVVVPLSAQGRTIGFIALGPKLSERPYNDSDLGLLVTLANQGAVAASNALKVEELRRTRDSLARADKLAALGKLASGVAHELNTPLGVIRGELQLMGPAAPQEDVDRIGRQVGKMERIIGDLLNFGRPVPPELGDVPARLLVERVVALLRVGDLRFKRPRIENDVDASLPPLWADASKLEQVLINLLINAAHATAEVPDPVIRIDATMRDRDLVLVVEDNGCGIPEGDRDRIFDPFFSTRSPGQGTGLGLSVSFGIVEEHGGKIAVESREGQGTRMILTLPTSARTPVGRA
jgi:signal transduction histidine kinase